MVILKKHNFFYNCGCLRNLEIHEKFLITFERVVEELKVQQKF